MYIEWIHATTIQSRAAGGRPTLRPTGGHDYAIYPFARLLATATLVSLIPSAVALCRSHAKSRLKAICIIYCRLTKNSLHLDDEIWTSPSIYRRCLYPRYRRPATGFFCGVCARTNGSWQLPSHDWSIAGRLVDRSTGNVYAPFLRICSASVLERHTRHSLQQQYTVHIRSGALVEINQPWLLQPRR